MNKKQYHVKITDEDGHWMIKFTSKMRASRTKQVMVRAMWGSGPLTCESIIYNASKMKTTAGKTRTWSPTSQQVGMVLGRNNLFRKTGYFTAQNVALWEIDESGFDLIERVENENTRLDNRC
jgi:hypothetical protein